MFRFCAALALCALASAVSAREGFVRTLEGRVFDGHVRFESNTVIVVNVAKEMRVEIALTNLASMAFAVEMPTVSETETARIETSLPDPWESVDIGSVRHAGGVDYRNGAFHVRATGTNVFAGSDSFHFVFKQITGTTEIVARVARVELTDPWARAGLMMRESLSADSRNVFLALTAARGGVLQWRERLAEETHVKPLRRMARGWLKLKRDGDVFIASRSGDGRQWTVIERLPMRAMRDLYVGLAVVGVRENGLNHSVFDHVEEGPSLRNRSFVPNIELQGGSAQMGYIARMDDTAIHFDSGALKVPVSTLSVANIRFQSVPARFASVLNAGQPGALLASGEFIDGECRSIEEGHVTLSSVPLGLCRFDANSEVIALVLRKRGPSLRHPFEVITRDGSIWQGTDVALDGNGVLVREPALGLRRIPAHDVVELRRRS